MSWMRILTRATGLALVAAASWSCGDVVRQSRAPVLLVIDSLSAAPGSDPNTFSNILASDVLTNVTSPAPCTVTAPCPTIFNDPGQVVLRLSLKDIGPSNAPLAPSTNNEVTINRFHVAYRRADGRNTPGVDVPYAFDGAATGTVPVTGTMTLGFQMVRNQAKQEPPLIQLATNGLFISTIADVTFYGRDQVGNDVSVTGSMEVDFANFGDK